MARKRSKNRKQRVTLRFKRREHLKSRLRVVGVRGVAFTLLIGFGVGLVSGHDSFASRFYHRHIPQIDVRSTPALAALPVQTVVAGNHFWIWLPGSGMWLEKRITRLFPVVRRLNIQRNFEANRIVITVEPRVPLVSWGGSGLDSEGVLFATVPAALNEVPRAEFLGTENKGMLSRWLLRLVAVPELWSQVAFVKEDSYGTMELLLKTGTVVTWGTLETEFTARKAQLLMQVLSDAHKNLSGASHADLRFFEQGRIIVLPKGK